MKQGDVFRLIHISRTEGGNANADKIFKEITNIQTLRDDIDGDGTVETGEVVGYRYTLVLSGFEKTRTSVDYNREYTDWSGTSRKTADCNRSAVCHFKISFNLSICSRVGVGSSANGNSRPILSYLT